MVDHHEILGPSSSPETGELVQALAKMQKSVGTVFMDKKNPHYKSNFISYQALGEQYVNEMVSNGLSMPDYRPGVLNDQWVCIGTLRHGPSGQWISGICPLLMPNKSDMQAFGAAMTYAKRTLFLALVGGYAGERDDDGNSIAATAKVDVRPGNFPASKKPASKAVESMSYEAMARKAIETAEDHAAATKALDMVEVRAREGAVDKDVFTRCKKFYTEKWSKA